MAQVLPCLTEGCIKTEKWPLKRIKRSLEAAGVNNLKPFNIVRFGPSAFPAIPPPVIMPVNVPAAILTGLYLKVGRSDDLNVSNLIKYLGGAKTDVNKPWNNAIIEIELYHIYPVTERTRNLGDLSHEHQIRITPVQWTRVGRLSVYKGLLRTEISAYATRIRETLVLVRLTTDLDPGLYSTADNNEDVTAANSSCLLGRLVYICVPPA